jgi:hypothetical protein
MLVAAAMVAITGCSQAPSLPPFQSAAIQAEPSQLKPFVGEWYAGGGTLWASISAEGTPTVRIRFSDGQLAPSATIQGHDLILQSGVGRNSYRSRFRATADGKAVLMGDYDGPSPMCCFCQYFVRGSASWAAEQRARERRESVKRFFVRAQDAVMNPLSKVL